MTESAFVTTSQILSEATNGFDELRIIAKDSHSLEPSDRAKIRQAADELEECQRRLIKLYYEFQQTQAHLIAVNEQLIEARKKPAPLRISGRISIQAPFATPYYGKL